MDQRTHTCRCIPHFYHLHVCFIRDKVEFDMTFLGMMVLQNKLKMQTKPAIHKLKEAKIRTVMVTGMFLSIF